MSRDYTYDTVYESSTVQKERRARRNRDRRRALSEGRVSKGDNTDIHHQSKGNLTRPVVRNRSKNRGDK
jgi:hypothetical protein